MLHGTGTSKLSQHLDPMNFLCPIWPGPHRCAEGFTCHLTDCFLLSSFTKTLQSSCLLLRCAIVSYADYIPLPICGLHLPNMCCSVGNNSCNVMEIKLHRHLNKYVNQSHGSQTVYSKSFFLGGKYRLAQDLFSIFAAACKQRIILLLSFLFWSRLSHWCGVAAPHFPHRNLTVWPSPRHLSSWDFPLIKHFIIVYADAILLDHCSSSVPQLFKQALLQMPEA